MTDQPEVYSEIEYYIDGLLDAGVNRGDIIDMAVKKFGEIYAEYVVYVVDLKTDRVSKNEFLSMLRGRDLDLGFRRAELEYAQRNGYVLMYGYSDDMIELEGAIEAAIDCYNGGIFHLSWNGIDWDLEEGKGINCIYANWYDTKIQNEDGVVIPWSFRTNFERSETYLTWMGDPWCNALLIDIRDLKQ